MKLKNEVRKEKLGVFRDALMMIEKLEHGKNVKELTKVAVRLLTAYINHVHTITGDSGTESADRQNIAQAPKTNFLLYTPIRCMEKGKH